MTNFTSHAGEICICIYTSTILLQRISKGNLQSYRCRLAKLGTVWNSRLTAFEKGRQGRPWDAKLQVEEQGVNPEYWQKFTEGNCSMKNSKENTDTLLTNAANKKTHVFDDELRTHTKNQDPPLHAAMPFRCYYALQI